MEINKKDILKEILINKNLDYINQYAKLIPLEEYNENYNVVLDDLFYVAKINNVINYNFFLDRKFYNKFDFFKTLIENLSGITDLGNNEYQLSLDGLLVAITDFLGKNTGITIYELQFKKEAISQKIYKTIFLLNNGDNFYILDLKKNNDQQLLLDIKSVIEKEIINNHGIIKKGNYLLNPILKTTQYEDLLHSQIPNVIKEEFNNYDYNSIYNKIDINYFLENDFIEKNYINTHGIDALFEGIRNKRRIVIYADYDSDGFNSAFQLHKLFRAIGYKNFVIIFPTREKNYINVIDGKEMNSDFTGYGITTEIAGFINNNDLLITVDNGGAQVDVFKYLLESKINIPVIIIDHHNLSYSDGMAIDDYYRLEDLFLREAGIKLNEIDTQKIILLKDDFPIYYNHPYIKAEFNGIAATIMTWLFTLEFLKRYNQELGLADRYIELLENLILHAGIGQITDVMSLLPTTKNVGLLIYILAKKIFQKSLDIITDILSKKGATKITGKKLLTFNEEYSKNLDFEKRIIKQTIKEVLFMPYQIDPKGRIHYTILNKEILLIMYSKKVGIFNVGNIGWMIGPLINIIGRTSSLSELMEYLTYITENQSDYNEKKEFISQFENIMEVTTIRRETVNEGKRLLSKFIEVYTNIDSDDFLYLPEDYLKILFLTNLEEFNFKEYNAIKELYLKLKDQGIVNNKKDLYSVSDRYGLSKEQIRLFNKGIINFISPFNGLVASKISESYNINTIIASSIINRYNYGLLLHGSGRGIGNINLNQFIQDIKSHLDQFGIKIDGGGHAGAVGLGMEVTMNNRIFSYEELLDKYYLIEKTIKTYIYNICGLDKNGKIYDKDKLINFYKPIIFRKIINIYQGNDLSNFIIKLYNIAKKFGIFGNDFTWKPIYIPFELWIKQIVENSNVKNYDNINYIINGIKLYVNIYTKKIVKEALKRKDYKWLSENYQFIKINIIEDNSGISGFTYEIVS